MRICNYYALSREQFNTPFTRGLNFKLFLLFVFLFSQLTMSQSMAANTQVSGVIEAHMGFGEDFEGNKGSDLMLATVEIALDAEISEWIGGHIVLLHEEDDTPLEVDQGYIEIGNSFLSSFNLQIGQVYVPFGVYESHFITDPVTLEIGETRETALVATYNNGIYASFYTFNGGLIEDGADDAIDSMGLNLGYAFEGEDFSMDIGFGYISNLGDSDGLSGTIEENTGDVITSEYVPGVTGHLVVGLGSFTLIGELVAATSEFAAGEIYPAQKAKPSAVNLEIALGVSDEITLAFAIQNTVDLAGILPENRTLFGLLYSINDATTVGFEYRSDSDYSTSDPGGTGESASSITFHLGTEF